MDFKGLSDPVVIFNKPQGKPGIFQKLRPPSTNFFNNKKILGGGLMALLLFAVGLGVDLSQKPTQLTPHASQETAVISIKPSSQNVSLNQQFQNDIFLDTGGLTVTVAQVKVTFDSSKLQLLSVSPGTFMPAYASPPVNTTSSTTFTVFSNPGKKGSGNIATLNFKAISETSGTPIKVQFDQTYTQAAATESGSLNIASGYLSSDITIITTSSPLPSPSSSACQSACVDGTFCINGTCQPLASPPDSCQQDNQCPFGFHCQAATEGGCTDSTSSTCTFVGSCQPMKPLPSSSPGDISSGDGNQDGNVDLQDLSILFSSWSPATDITSHLQLDFNNDRRINSLDYSQLNQLLVSSGILHQ